ncbi:hypothetical protein HK101_008707 [Irineochytrium annulatum]|nr:hypothetical protein HK101_008707 [Irineochytrium annulatum]
MVHFSLSLLSGYAAVVAMASLALATPIDVERLGYSAAALASRVNALLSCLTTSFSVTIPTVPKNSSTTKFSSTTKATGSIKISSTPTATGAAQNAEADGITTCFAYSVGSAPAPASALAPGSDQNVNANENLQTKIGYFNACLDKQYDNLNISMFYGLITSAWNAVPLAPSATSFPMTTAVGDVRYYNQDRTAWGIMLLASGNAYQMLLVVNAEMTALGNCLEALALGLPLPTLAGSALPPTLTSYDSATLFSEVNSLNACLAKYFKLTTVAKSATSRPTATNGAKIDEAAGIMTCLAYGQAAAPPPAAPLPVKGIMLSDPNYGGYTTAKSDAYGLLSCIDMSLQTSNSQIFESLIIGAWNAVPLTTGSATLVPPQTTSKSDIVYAGFDVTTWLDALQLSGEGYQIFQVIDAEMTAFGSCLEALAVGGPLPGGLPLPTLGGTTTSAPALTTTSRAAASSSASTKAISGTTFSGVPIGTSTSSKPTTGSSTGVTAKTTTTSAATASTPTVNPLSSYSTSDLAKTVSTYLSCLTQNFPAVIPKTPAASGTSIDEAGGIMTCIAYAQGSAPPPAAQRLPSDEFNTLSDSKLDFTVSYFLQCIEGSYSALNMVVLGLLTGAWNAAPLVTGTAKIVPMTILQYDDNIYGPFDFTAWANMIRAEGNSYQMLQVVNAEMGAFGNCLEALAAGLPLPTLAASTPATALITGAPANATSGLVNTTPYHDGVGPRVNGGRRANSRVSLQHYQLCCNRIGLNAHRVCRAHFFACRYYDQPRRDRIGAGVNRDRHTDYYFNRRRRHNEPRPNYNLNHHDRHAGRHLDVNRSNDQPSHDHDHDGVHDNNNDNNDDRRPRYDVYHYKQDYDNDRRPGRDVDRPRRQHGHIDGIIDRQDCLRDRRWVDNHDPATLGAAAGKATAIRIDSGAYRSSEMGIGSLAAVVVCLLSAYMA